MATYPRERYSLESLGATPLDGGGIFVDHLLMALVACGLRELSMGHRSDDRIFRATNQALGIISAHTLIMARRLYKHRHNGDPRKIRGYMTVGEAVAASSVGAYDFFWHYVRQSCVSWTNEGKVSISYSPPHAQQMLEEEFTWEYRRFLLACAELIRRKLYGR